MHLYCVLAWVCPVNIARHPVNSDALGELEAIREECFWILAADVRPLDLSVGGVCPVDMALHAVNVNTRGHLRRENVDGFGSFSIEGNFEYHHPLSHQHEITLKLWGWFALIAVPKKHWLASALALVVSGWNTVCIWITNGRVFKTRGRRCTVVSVPSEASDSVTVTVIAPLCGIKQASGKSAAVVDDIAAYLGLLIACQLAIPQVAGLALTKELIIGLTVHTPGMWVTVLQDAASSIGS